MIPVVVTATATDNCGGSPTCAITMVTSNEPVDEPMNTFTPAQVDHAFRAALGVPFARVVAEAHAYTYRALGITS